MAVTEQPDPQRAERERSLLESIIRLSKRNEIEKAIVEVLEEYGSGNNNIFNLSTTAAEKILNKLDEIDLYAS